MTNSNLSSWIGVECWCDFGANLVQHFIGRYSRYSRYRTKTHDKCTISHVFPRYSRYQTVLLKLEEIISTEGRNFKKHFASRGVLFVISWMNWGAMKSACGRINPLTWMKSLSRRNPTSSGYGGRFHITRGLPRISSERSEDFIRFCGFHHSRWFHFLPPSCLLLLRLMI